MKPANVKQLISDLFSDELSVDDPHELYEQAARAEAYIPLVLEAQAEAENELASAERTLREAGKAIKHIEGTAVEKKVLFEAMVAPLQERADILQSEVRYYLNVSRALERRVSLAQSIMSSLRSQIKAGITIDNRV